MEKDQQTRNLALNEEEKEVVPPIQDDVKAGEADATREKQLQNELLEKTKELEEVKKQLSEAQSVIEKLGYSDAETAMTTSKYKNLDKITKNAIEEVRNVARQDFMKIQELFSKGKIDEPTAIKMKNHVEKKLAEEESRIKAKVEVYGEKLADNINSKVLEAFSSKKQGFFDTPERAEIIEYLRASNGVLDMNVLEKAAALVEKLEASAQSRFNREKEKEKQFKTLNDQAKNRLVSAVSESGSGIGDTKKSFSREQLKKMSTKEFEKYEKQILEQILSGKLG